jgi:hypothetical protein
MLSIQHIPVVIVHSLQHFLTFLLTYEKVGEEISILHKVDPLLRFYSGSPHMCISNEQLKEGRGNGSLCKCVSIKLKQDAVQEWKKWEGKKVWTVSARDVDYILFKHRHKPPPNKPVLFKLTPKQFTNATIKYPLTTDHIQHITNVRILQVPVNSNVATTGHKLQGMSKGTLSIHTHGIIELPIGYTLSWQECKSFQAYICAHLLI